MNFENNSIIFLGRQALEAQRDDCTVLVYRLNFNATEKDVFNFFARAGIGRVIDIKVIRDPRSAKSKGVAYVEFESQESVLLAVALSGQPIRGNFYLGNYKNFKIKIPVEEPKKFVYLASGR